MHQRDQERNLLNVELHQLHSHALTEALHGELGGSVDIIEHHTYQYRQRGSVDMSDVRVQNQNLKQVSLWCTVTH